MGLSRQNTVGGSAVTPSHSLAPDSSGFVPHRGAAHPRVGRGRVFQELDFLPHPGLQNPKTLSLQGVGGGAALPGARGKVTKLRARVWSPVGSGQDAVLLRGGVRKTEGSLSLECPEGTSAAFPPHYCPSESCRPAWLSPPPSPCCPGGWYLPGRPLRHPEPRPQALLSAWPQASKLRLLRKCEGHAFGGISQNTFFSDKTCENHNFKSFSLVQKTLPKRVLSTNVCHRNA